MLLLPTKKFAKGLDHSYICRSCYTLLSKVLSVTEKAKQLEDNVAELKRTVGVSLEAVYPHPSCSSEIDGAAAGELAMPQHEESECTPPAKRAC